MNDYEKLLREIVPPYCMVSACDLEEPVDGWKGWSERARSALAASPEVKPTGEGARTFPNAEAAAAWIESLPPAPPRCESQRTLTVACQKQAGHAGKCSSEPVIEWLAPAPASEARLCHFCVAQGRPPHTEGECPHHNRPCPEPDCNRKPDEPHTHSVPCGTGGAREGTDG